MGAPDEIHNQHTLRGEPVQDENEKYIALLCSVSQVEFFALYADDPSDLVSVNSTTATKGKFWAHARSCTLCHGKCRTHFF